MLASEFYMRLIHHQRQNVMQLNKLNSTKKQKRKEYCNRHTFLIQYLGPKHLMITSKMIVFGIKSDFAIMFN